VTQVSAYVDGIIASLLGTGAAMAVANAQLLYTLPVSLFGMSVSAAELPAMAAERGAEGERAAALRQRLESGLRRIAYFIVPCAVAFLAVGQAAATVVFQSGRFTAADSRYVWAILAGSGVGLLAATLSRLTASAFYALSDARTPLRYAVIRVALATTLGFAAAFGGPRLLGVETRWGAVGLTLASSLAAWLEFALLRRRLAQRIGAARLPAGYLAQLLVAAAVAGALAWMAGTSAEALGATAGALLALATFGVVYAGATLAAGVPEARALLRRGAARG
jgi:putative peptidoglycan lipid II flippase